MDQKKKTLESQLRKAVNDGQPRLVQLLLSQGACPDLVGSKGVAAMHLAVGKESEKNTRCLKMLLQSGANPNVRSSDGLTPLHIAALWGCFQNLKMLLMNGGDPNIKDKEGNTPGHLAEQQENRKCALLLQEYQTSSAEEDGFPQFQYSVYSDQSDMSSYPGSDYSFTSHSSIISDFGEAPLSSTRRSSFLNPYNRLSNMETKTHHSQDWDNSFARWAAEGPSILSSTRMSCVGTVAPMPILKEDDVFTDEDFSTLKSKENAATTNSKMSPSRRDTLPALLSRRASRKSVSFRDVDEYFPVFSPNSPKEQPAGDGRQSPSYLSFDLSEYSDFLDSDRMATVLNKQGIDVTSPDHVYIFCRESSTSTEEDMEKTVISHCALEESDDEQQGEDVKNVHANVTEKPTHPCGGSSSSGTTSSHYSSCESDHYTSALDVSLHPRRTLLPEAEEVSADSESEAQSGKKTSTHSDSVWQYGNLPHVKLQMDSEHEMLAHLPGILDELNLCETKHTNSDAFACDGHVADNTTEVGVDNVATRLTRDTKSDQAAEISEDVANLPFTPSPFVTGRTRSRLSRCLLRTSRTPESLFTTSSLFEETLPTPVRSHRQTPRYQSIEEYYSSPHIPCFAPTYAGHSTGEDSLHEESQDTQSSTLKVGSTVSSSQADTLILPKSIRESDTESQTLSDTFVLEKKLDSSLNAYEKNLDDIMLAMQCQDQNLSEGGDFMTDDLTSTDEATTKGKVNDNPVEDGVASLKNEDGWLTEDWSTQPDSVSSSSSSSYFSPRRSREDSDPPCTPGTGCTPRYSMSRVSSCHRPQSLANLSYTPGGRPLIQDLDEPVEYLYTDTKHGHKLIETHVPPTANTSLSSSMSTTSSEDTILYDWHSLQAKVVSNGGKENQKPLRGMQKEKNGEREDRFSPETKGMTDKELRQRLLEMGESPGPISSRTRPTYLRRLCRLLQESNSQSPHHQKQLDQPQTQTGYNPELRRALHTFKLPSCQADEQDLCLQFDQPDQNRKWREGIIKSSFNYLLLDPRVTKNLPFRSHTMTPQECFQTFIHAIFYVGKGKRSRPYSHLYEALEYHRGDKTSKKLCPKVQHILEVWNAGQGVISLHCFQNVIPVEAYTREACMVEAIGLKMLTNQKRGDFYGVVSNWQTKRKQELGVHLLYRAMQIFLAEGERQLRPADIRQ
ncbi:ankyrin repeat and LEM domain-containing protein 1 [Solea senegalensis]|uniref:Ankyrin repeat and LEM domain-containing protein 1 n=1 Tax=Solea senegalensis TaxID=28829 RepID=A0AAV6PKZ4_SOLSE|nr:ankyrin repeat and LEM domain-containing protein 1 [Solea senegalensis]KAG7466685.1 ankyrin repeat and LEM domain-containing protein 1 [Solea senegalensis]